MKQIHSEITKLSSCKLKIKITVDKSLVKEIYNECCIQVSKTVQLPGFRKGNVPLDLVRKKFANVIASNFIETIINRTLPEVLKEHNISYIEDSLQISSTNFPYDDNCSYEVILETEPEVKLKNYKGLKLTKEVRKVVDADIEKTIEHLKDNYSKLIPSQKNVVELQDVNSDKFYYVLNYKIFIDGKELKKYAGKNVLINPSKETLIYGVKEGIVGMKIGEKKNIVVKFPDNVPQTELRGKQATLEVELLEIKEKSSPSVEELVELLGFKNVDELKNSIRERLRQEYDNETKHKLRQQIYKILLDEHSFSLPESEVEKHYQEIIEELSKNQQFYNTTDKPELKLTEEQQKQLKKKAEDEIKLKYILKKIMQQENIQLTNEELEKEKGKLRVLYPGREKAVDEYFEKNLATIASNMIEEKIFDFIVSHAKIKEVDITSK